MADDKAPVDPRYPGKRYHATKAPVYVQTAEDDAALGPGWYGSPKLAAKAAAEAKGAK